MLAATKSVRVRARSRQSAAACRSAGTLTATLRDAAGKAIATRRRRRPPPRWSCRMDGLDGHPRCGTSTSPTLYTLDLDARRRHAHATTLRLPRRRVHAGGLPPQRPAAEAPRAQPPPVLPLCRLCARPRARRSATPRSSSTSCTSTSCAPRTIRSRPGSSTRCDRLGLLVLRGNPRLAAYRRRRPGRPRRSRTSAA